MNEVSRILDRIQKGEPSAAAALLPLVYEELRKLAAGHMANEAPGHTLDATALVHEAYLRLVSPVGERQFANHQHFFAAAAEAMRRILVDSARRKQALKRGASPKQLPLNPDRLVAPIVDVDSWIDVDEVLRDFEEVDSVAAELAKLRIFGGLSVEEAGEALAADPKNMNYQVAYAATGTSVCSLLDFMGYSDEANVAAQKLKPVVERLIAENPNVPGYKSNLALIVSLQGRQATKAHRLDEAVPLLREALTLFERLGAENPRATYYQHRIAAGCRHLGLIPPPHIAQDEGLNLLRRAETLLRDLPNPDTVAIYDLACTQALIGGRTGRGEADAAERERYEGMAMETLSRAIAAGYNDLGNIRGDPDLDALRGREDFEKLLAELGVAGKDGKE